MAIDWYRQTVQGLHPDYPDGAHIFHGTTQEFSGLSSNPLSNEYGALTPISWQLRYSPQNNSTELIYIEAKQETPILNWSGSRVRFVYFDDKQEAHDSWPPPLGLPAQLPQQIHLEVKSTGIHDSIVASPMGPLQPLPRLQDL
jgi:hypothetical protein